MCDVLRSLIINNIEHYHSCSSSSVEDARFYKILCEFLDNLNGVEEGVKVIVPIAPNYDFDENTPGNGYRSFVVVYDCCITQAIRLCRTICMGRESFLFRKEHYLKEVEAMTAVLACLKVGFVHLQTLISWSKPNSLFPGDEHSPEELLMEADNVDTSCFYGRCLGFQYVESMRKPLKVIALLMAAFSDAYYNTGGMLSRTASSLVSCGKYVYSPEARAKRIVEVSQKATVDFCKAFWLLQESTLMQQVPNLVCTPIPVNKVLMLPPEPLTMTRYDGTSVDIPIPYSHVGPRPIACRLLSASYRDGQFEKIELNKSPLKVLPPSPCLVFQCHGGGFVAQSSKSHEMYLRDWAYQLDVPIFCIDYTLAPEAPFPRALEECLYAYSWAINNCHRLGSTASKIILVGDSAGGNILMGLVMKTIELGIRKPDGILAIYTPFLVEFLPSPSRILCIMDPLIPFSFMMRCLKAYAGEAPSRPQSRKSNESTTEKPASLVNHCSMEDSVRRDTNVKHKADDESSSSESFEELSRADVTGADSVARRPSNSSTIAIGDVVSDTMSTVSLGSEAQEVAILTEQNAGSEESPNAEAAGNDYISEFMSWYMLDAEELEGSDVLQSEAADAEENVLFEMPSGIPGQISERISSVTGCVFGGISGLLPNWAKPGYNCDRKGSSQDGIFVDRVLPETGTIRSLIDEFNKFKVARDPYLSPFLAKDEVLQQFPPVKILTVQLDPCLDDCVMFARRLRELQVPITLDVLEGLPHGFLNFSLLSKEAHRGSNLCVQRLRELLKLSGNTHEC